MHVVFYTLCCSCPCTNVTISHKKQTKAHSYYSEHFTDTVSLQHVSPVKRPSSGSVTDTDTFQQ